MDISFAVQKLRAKNQQPRHVHRTHNSVPARVGAIRTRIGILTVLAFAGIAPAHSADSPNSPARSNLSSPTEETISRTSSTAESFCVAHLPPSSVLVQTKEAPVSIVRTATAPIATEQQKADFKSPDVFGQTQQRKTFEFNTGVSKLAVPNTDVTCATVHLTLSIAIAQHDVWITPQVKEQTCAYREVWAHESRHVAVNSEVLRLAAESLRNEMTQAYADKIYYSTPTVVQDATEELRRGVDGRWTALLATFNATGRHLQEEIDTKDEYSRFSRACEGGGIARMDMR